MSPRVTKAHLEARRREILAAGFHCFARAGLHATTMQDIADEADLSAGALYRYFESKEALVRALAADSAGRRAEAFGRLEPGGGADALADLVFEMMGALQTDDGEASVRLDVRLWAEMLDRPEDRELVLDAFASVAEPVAAYVRAERKAGRIRGGGRSRCRRPTRRVATHRSRAAMGLRARTRPGGLPRGGAGDAGGPGRLTEGADGWDSYGAREAALCPRRPPATMFP